MKATYAGKEVNEFKGHGTSLMVMTDKYGNEAKVSKRGTSKIAKKLGE
jgi:hypothetical protein